jgi:hypothetical protein
LGHSSAWRRKRERHDELRTTTFYEPPHDITHRELVTAVLAEGGDDG